MVQVSKFTQGNGSFSAPRKSFNFSFSLYGPTNFGPFYSPQRISISKQRKIDQKENFCGGEDVADIGEENREIHLSGLLLRKEIRAFNRLVDEPLKYILVTDIWNGEVVVKGGDIEGPVMYDPQHKQSLFSYSIDMVSTGKDEGSNDDNDGIISGGR